MGRAWGLLRVPGCFHLLCIERQAAGQQLAASRGQQKSRSPKPHCVAKELPAIGKLHLLSFFLGHPVLRHDNPLFQQTGKNTELSGTSWFDREILTAKIVQPF